MREDENFRLLASRLSDQVAELCNLVSTLQNSITVLSKENASLRSLFDRQSSPKSSLISIDGSEIESSSSLNATSHVSLNPNEAKVNTRSFPFPVTVNNTTKTLISTPQSLIPSTPQASAFLNQPSPIQLFSSSPLPFQLQDEFMMSYLSSTTSSPNLDPATDRASAFLFDNLSSPMMGGYYNDSMDEEFKCFKTFGLGNEQYVCNTRTDLNLNYTNTNTTNNKNTYTLNDDNNNYTYNNTCTNYTNSITKSTRKSIRRPSGPLNILIVEDDPLCQQLISHIIKSLHIGNYELVADGVEAVINMSTGSFDLILMDMQLPHLDGLQATQNIRKFNRRTPIVSMTARLSEEDVRRYFEGGIDEVLPKPFSKQSVLRIIEQFYKLTVSDSDEVTTMVL